MWLKNDGYILAELLLSLTILLMLSLFFTPLLIDLSAQTRKLQVEKQAYQLLYEELQAFIVNPLSSQNHTTVINGIDYQINLQDTTVAGQKEVCVKIEKNRFNKETNICQLSE
jgi:type II secretory pathway pseudopilin PulG